MARMTKVGKLYKRRREELFLRSDTRVSYSNNDILIEDFYHSQNHPYAIFDMNGNLLETNNEDKDLFRGLLNQNLCRIVYLINKYGVEVR